MVNFIDRIRMKCPGGEDANEILPFLWIGNGLSATDDEFISEKDINVIINCTKKIIPSEICEHRYNFDILDNSEMDQIVKMFKKLDYYTDVIENHRKDNNKILVNCFAGKQRSATIVAAYLMKYTKMSKKEAINLIKFKRECCFTPNINFNIALNMFELKLKK